MHLQDGFADGCSWEVENGPPFQGNASWDSPWSVLLLGAALRAGLGAADRVTCRNELLRLTSGICSLSRENPSGSVGVGWCWRQVFPKMCCFHTHTSPSPCFVASLLPPRFQRSPTRLGCSNSCFCSACRSLFPFSFCFQVNLSDCHNVIVFLAPSVVSQSLPP